MLYLMEDAGHGHETISKEQPRGQEKAVTRLELTGWMGSDKEAAETK